MGDVVDKEIRSRIMAANKSKNTKPELIFRRLIHRSGFRYTLHNNKLPGKPDLVLPKYKAVIFIHGCFWHRHNCKRSHIPDSNREYWELKLQRNVDRFRRQKFDLLAEGWRVLVVWECSLLPDFSTASHTIKKAVSWIKGNSRTLEI